MRSNFFVAQNPVAWPEEPKHWSYSAIASFRQCPKKWALNNALHAGWASPPYPSNVTRALMVGNIVHDQIDTFRKEYLNQDLGLHDFFRQFGLRSRVSEAIQNEVERQSENPRFSSNLFRPIRIKDCLNFVKRAVLELPKEPSRKGRYQAEQTFRPGFRISEPNLTGIPDFFDGESLIEYKTGEMSDAHIDQVIFYASLIGRATNGLPKKTVIKYLKFNETVDLSEKVVELRDSFLTDLAEELAGWQRYFESQNWPAFVGEHCSNCHVRHLCEDYWDKIASEKVANLGDEFRGFIDIDLKVGEEIRSSGTGKLAGASLNSGLTGTLTYLPKETIDSGVRLRLLNGYVSAGHGELRVSQRRGSEIFFCN